MKKAVLISIRPKWCEKIASGEKAIEVRRTRPKLEVPFKCYIYCTMDKHLAFMQNKTGTSLIACMDAGNAIPVGGFAGNGKIIGEFVCDKIYEVAPRWKEYIVLGEDRGATNKIARDSCLSFDDMKVYLGEKNGYGWHISNLEIYDYPKKLGDFTAVCRYKNDDETCPSRKIACSFQRYDYNHDGSVNLVECGNSVRRPPQNWQYVEELK